MAARAAADGDDAGIYTQIESDEAEAIRLQAEENAAAMGREESRRQFNRNVTMEIEEAREQSARIMCIYLFFALVEIAATTTVLILSWNVPCDKPLATFLVFYTGRYIIHLPLSVMRFAARRRGEDTTPYRMLAAWIDFLVFVWFIVGNVWLFTADSCPSTNSLLWHYTLILVILVYIGLLLPFILLLGICLCLPCILIVMRLLAEPVGASDEVINRLPTRVFDDGSVKGEARGDKDAPSCCVCMNNYAFGDELRKMPCGHEFHSKCVDPWLKLKKTCPLCRHDVTQAMPASRPAAAAAAADSHHSPV